MRHPPSESPAVSLPFKLFPSLCVACPLAGTVRDAPAKPFSFADRYTEPLANALAISLADPADL